MTDLWGEASGLYFQTHLNPGNLIKRRIANHDRRITNKNKNNKVFYDIGARVRLQEVKSKEFKIMGTVTDQRIADSGEVVSYEIDTDLGYKTTWHRRFMKPLAAEHDPKELNKFVTKPTEKYNQTNLEALNDDTAAEQVQTYQRRLGNLELRGDLII